MDKIKFSIEDKSAREIVRAIFFQWLKEGKFNQFPNSIEPFKDKVDFVGVRHPVQERFLLLAQEIFWELIIQGIITPGLNAMNPNLPFFRFTEYGRKVLDDEGYVPHDPSEYLSRYKNEISIFDDVILNYLEESLKGFSSGCYLSANMMLGIASERIFLSLCSCLHSSLQNSREAQNFKKVLNRISMIAKFEFVQNKIEEVLKSKPEGFPRNIKTALFGIAEFLRFQRNEIGHPQDDLQIPSREDVYVNLRIFPQYCKAIENLMIFLKNNKI